MVEHRLVDRARKHKPIRETEVTYNRKHSHQRRRESAEYGSSDIGDVDLDLERLAGLWLEHAEVAGESDQSGLLVVELELVCLPNSCHCRPIVIKVLHRAKVMRCESCVLVRGKLNLPHRAPVSCCDRVPQRARESLRCIRPRACRTRTMRR